MRVVSCIVLVVTLAAGAASTFGAEKPKAAKPETSHLAFVTEYIRELAANENIRASLPRSRSALAHRLTTTNRAAIHEATAHFRLIDSGSRFICMETRPSCHHAERCDRIGVSPSFLHRVLPMPHFSEGVFKPPLPLVNPDTAAM